MEFLNPEDKRKRSTRLFVGYGLVAVLVGLATLLLVYLAQGYNYDIDSGVVQNGLIFVESKPVSANIYIDGQQKSKTGARLILGEGQHCVVLKQDKYRDWSKTFNLEGGSVLYFIYPKLFPVDIAQGITKVYADPPAWVSQSLDRQWLLLQQNATSPVFTIVDLSKPTDEPKLSTIPSGQLKSLNGQFGTITVQEWSDDNHRVLFKQTLSDGTSDYIVFDIENADQSLNITKEFNLTTNDVVSLRDKKYDKYYVHNQITGELRTADIKNGLTTSPLITSVVTFKSYADDLVLYTTYEDAKIDEADVFILSDKTNRYRLKSVPKDANKKYLLDIAQFDNNWYYVVASSSDKSVEIFRNPLKRTKAGNKDALKPQMMLSLPNPQYVSFSDNARFIAMQSGKQFVVYDGEQNRVFRFESTLSIAAAQQAKWMDGHRFCIVVDGKIKVFEFDGANLQEIGISRPEYNAYFDRDYKHVYSLVQQVDGKTGFESGQLFAN